MIGSLFKGMLRELDGLGMNSSMLDSGNRKSKGGFSEINWEYWWQSIRVNRNVLDGEVKSN